MSGSACGGECHWPHAYREDGTVRICDGPPGWLQRVWRRVAGHG